MEKEARDTLMKQILKVKGGTVHFFAFHPCKGNDEPKIVLDRRKRPIRTILAWKKEGLPVGKIVEGRARPGKKGVEFVTYKEPPGGTALFARKMKLLGIPQLKTASLVVDLALDMHAVEEDEADEEVEESLSNTMGDWPNRFEQASSRARAIFESARSLNTQLDATRKDHANLSKAVTPDDGNEAMAALKQAGKLVASVESGVHSLSKDMKELAAIDLSFVKLTELDEQGQVDSAALILDKANPLMDSLEEGLTGLGDLLKTTRQKLAEVQQAHGGQVQGPQEDATLSTKLKAKAGGLARLRKSTYSQIETLSSSVDKEADPEKKRDLEKQLKEKTGSWIEKNLDRFDKDDLSKLEGVWDIHEAVAERGGKGPKGKDITLAVKVLTRKLEVLEGQPRPVNLGAARKLRGEIEKWTGHALAAEDMDATVALGQIHDSLSKLAPRVFGGVDEVQEAPQEAPVKDAKKVVEIGKELLATSKLLDELESTVEAWAEKDRNNGSKAMQVRVVQWRLDLEEQRNQSKKAPKKALQAVEKIHKGATSNLAIARKWLKVSDTWGDAPVNPVMIPEFADAPPEKQKSLMDQANKRVSSGRNLMQTLLKDPSLFDDEANIPREAIVDLCWYLRSVSEDKSGMAWSAGALTIPDTDGKVRAFLDRCLKVYGRASSHLNKDQKEKGGQARGIDFYEGEEDPNLLLPYGMKTLLYQRNERDGDQRLYIKMETEGARIGPTFWRRKDETPESRNREWADWSRSILHLKNLLIKQKDKTGMGRRAEKWVDRPLQVRNGWNGLMSALKTPATKDIADSIKKSGVKLKSKPDIGEMIDILNMLDGAFEVPENATPKALKQLGLADLLTAMTALHLAIEDAWGGEDDEDDLLKRIGDEVVLGQEDLV